MINKQRSDFRLPNYYQATSHSNSSGKCIIAELMSHLLYYTIITTAYVIIVIS